MGALCGAEFDLDKPAGRILWDRRSLPTSYVSSRLGISRRELGTAIHEIKLASGLRGNDLVVIYEDGT
jgi:hypothetical protein